MKRLTVTVGIPAYNEEKNIARLLGEILSQYRWGLRLVQVVVISDGSTDKTAEIVRSINDSRILLNNHKKRQGINKTLSDIARLATGDILILLDADVKLPNHTLLHEITLPFRRQKTLGMVGANVMSLPGKTFFERVIAVSHRWKKYQFDRLAGGNTVYNCHGRARALRREFYKTLRIPNGVPEDAYTYFLCLRRGFSFCYQPNALVYFRSPGTFADHRRQSVRFMRGKKALTRTFEERTIRDAYRIPASLFITSTLLWLAAYPIEMLSYFTVLAIVSRNRHAFRISHTRWQPSLTSKEVT